MPKEASEHKRTYRTGRPSFWDVAQGAPAAYAYSRFTKEPVTFHEGPANFRGDFGQHSDFPAVGGIDVDVTRRDPQNTLRHETMHHAFPWYMNKDKQHGYIDALESEDERVRDVGLGELPEEADESLLRRILGLGR